MSYNEWLDIDVLEDYLDGKLDVHTMHKVEKLSLEDPFVAEALAGLSQSPKRTHSLSLLQKQLQERVALKPVEEKRWRITSQRLSIAAAAAVLFVTVSILFWMIQNNQQLQTAKQTKKVEIKIAPKVVPASPVATPNATSSANSDRVAAIKKPASTPPEVVTSPIKTSSAPVADKTAALAKKDTVAFVATNVAAAKEKERAAAYVVTISDEQKATAKRKVEAKTERALPGKAEGVYAAAQPGLVTPIGTINGKVYTKTDGQPLPGAVVRVPGTNKATVTNTKGEFTLPADSTTQSLSIGYIGYTSQVVKAQANQSVNISLEASAANALNEVVVATVDKDFSKIAKQSLIVSRPAKALPVGGWERFEDYIIANHRLYRDKQGSRSVTVSFEVRNDGRPRRIKILNGLSKAENEEAMRLIKEGPNWAFNAKVQSATLGIKF